ncbi:tetratricopeptide repeat protein [Aurantibacillus circumpalustris]|uniref:tetratricopeptide repeat protein n=1 Tax=Aurantibacillus circumpalustris TaxID=3036359 RepID=UPI00295BCAFD|nr:tetratricopeptide repeat protein [Aurantibacillus circumpalustris]
MKKPSEILTEFENKLKTIKDPKERIKEIVDFSVIYGDNYSTEILPLLEEGIELAREIGDKVGETLCFCNLSFLIRVTGVKLDSKYSTTLEELTQMVQDIKPYTEDYAMGLNMLAYFHWFRGEFEKAFNLSFECLKLVQKKVIGVAWNHFGLAVFYFDTKDFENSKIHYQKALETFIELDHEYGKARASNGLGSIAIIQNHVTEALSLLEYAASIYRKLGHNSGLSRAANDLGLLENRNKNHTKAIAYLQESIELRKEINHVQGLITSYTELGETYQMIQDHPLALIQLEKGLSFAVTIKNHQKEMRIHKLFYDSYKALNKTDLALYHFEKYFEVKSQILSDEAANSIKKVQTRYEKEKSEKEAELERFKNVELKKANTIIEQKNKDITDSINYAKRIQLGILPQKEILDKCFDNYFVLYKPKDIVSGDFYWASESTNHLPEKNLPVIAAIDCTGHGVPGAFMSMLGNTLLNQTVANPEIRTAADILNYLNYKLPENIKSTGGEQSIRDGMDMGLSIFDFKKSKMQYAGANNPCWVIRNNQIIELKGDKQAITASTDSVKRAFVNQVFDLKKDDMVYLFTDGFADQFGGPNEKKFSYKRLRELLIAISTESCEQQKDQLYLAFENWRGDLEQIDDVCVIGIKI